MSFSVFETSECHGPSRVYNYQNVIEKQKQRIVQIIFTFLSYFLLKPTGISTETRWLVLGDSTKLDCVNSNMAVNIPVWRFNGEVIFADKIPAGTSRFNNVRGFNQNSSYSYLYIEHFKKENVGKYECLVATNKTDFLLNITGKLNNNSF